MVEYDGKERAYYASLKFALEDGMIDHEEFTHLSDMRESLGISTELHNKMELEIRESHVATINLDGSPKSTVKDSVVSNSNITTVGQDYVKGDKIVQKGVGNIENYAKMCISAVQMGKLENAVEIYNKAKEIDIDEAEKVFEKKYGKEIAAAYAIAAVPLLYQVKTGPIGEWGEHFSLSFTECNVCTGNALAFDPDNVEANIIQGQAYLAFRERSSPENPHLVKAEAIERFEKALSQDPDNQEAQKGLNEARKMSTTSNDCFITTATVNYLGESDNGQTLNTLRHFRDTVMNKTPEGRKQIQWYYANAPQIVISLDNLKNKEEIYTELYNHYILPAAKVYRNQQSDSAFNLYKEGIEFALKKIESS